MTKVSNPRLRAPGRKSRLSEKDWLEAALILLADGGIDAVRVEPLASRLGVTKGSFYKRYGTRDELLAAMLDYWRRESTLDVIETLSSIDEPANARFARILAISERRPDVKERARMELALRMWAHTDPRAAATMEEIDHLRLQYFRSVVESDGFEGAEAMARAFLVYAFGVLDGIMPGKRDRAVIECCRSIVAGTSRAASKGPD